mmetsp:Transcript_119040/g.322979  ORF Transcript_119040/g.322979 Transcript_119040/m.322979 type:complete len:214 (+) Transcript_119040:254-895(+)
MPEQARARGRRPGALFPRRGHRRPHVPVRGGARAARGGGHVPGRGPVPRVAGPHHRRQAGGAAAPRPRHALRAHAAGAAPGAPRGRGGGGDRGAAGGAGAAAAGAGPAGAPLAPGDAGRAARGRRGRGRRRRAAPQQHAGEHLRCRRRGGRARAHAQGGRRPAIRDPPRPRRLGREAAADHGDRARDRKDSVQALREGGSCDRRGAAQEARGL